MANELERTVECPECHGGLEALCEECGGRGVIPDRRTKMRLVSTPMINTPGILRYCRAMFQEDPDRAMFIFSSGFPQLRSHVIRGLVDGTIEVEVIDENVIFEKQDEKCPVCAGVDTCASNCPNVEWEKVHA